MSSSVLIHSLICTICTHQGFNQEDLEEEKGDGDMKETADESDSDDNIKRGKQ